jgi:hypothetical protein
MSSSPCEMLWNGDEDVATPFLTGQCQDAPLSRRAKIFEARFRTMR